MKTMAVIIVTVVEWMDERVSKGMNELYYWMNEDIDEWTIEWMKNELDF